MAWVGHQSTPTARIELPNAILGVRWLPPSLSVQLCVLGNGRRIFGSCGIYLALDYRVGLFLHFFAFPSNPPALKHT